MVTWIQPEQHSCRASGWDFASAELHAVTSKLLPIPELTNLRQAKLQLHNGASAVTSMKTYTAGHILFMMPYFTFLALKVKRVIVLMILDQMRTESIGCLVENK